jgi:hypothetical protein
LTISVGIFPATLKRKGTALFWSDKKADTEFSLFIRARDGHCLFPGCEKTEGLQNSHFIGRRHSATRYDPENCIALCYSHHYGDKLLGYEYQKQEKEKHGYDGQYTLFMKKHLGTKRYRALMERGKTTVKRSTEIAKLMELINGT